MSAQLAMMGVNVLMNLADGYVQGEIAAANNTVRRAEVDAETTVRGANNELASKVGALNRYNRNVNNKRAVEAGAARADVALVNYQRARDNETRASLEEQIQFAEQEGMAAAAGAFSGLTGGVLDVVNSTVALRKMRSLQARQEARKLGAFDAAQLQGNIIREALEGTDNSSIADTIDYSVSLFAPQRRQGNWLTDIAKGVDAKGISELTNRASKFSFSTPKLSIGPRVITEE